MTRRAASILPFLVAPLASTLPLLTSTQHAAAQGATSATLRGTVTDPSGAVLPGASATLTSVRTRAVRTATTDDRGSHVFVGLAPGDYRLRVALPGFAPWESGDVHLSPGDSLQLDARLTLAGQTEQVDVTAVREMVRTDQGAREGLITAQQIQSLSIISRGAMELLRILPGAVTPDQNTMETVGFDFGGANSLGDYSVNGNRGTQMSPVLDGSKIVDFGSNAGVMLNLNPDMVEEVKIQTGNYAAEHGSPSIQISAVTKGGASRFHGSVYDYWRNWRLAANDRSNSYAGLPRPESNFQYPGFSLSGPVRVPGTGFNENRDKLFFFVGYEYQRQTIDTGTSRAVVPTAAQRNGDFSELLTGAGQNLGQPRTVTIPWGFPGAGQPAPDNDLSPYVDPIGLAYMSLYPLPNHADPDNRYNYAYNEAMPLNRWQLTSRLDWNVNERTHAYVRLALEKERQEWFRGIWNCCSHYELPSAALGDNQARSVAANLTSVLSPSLTNEVVFSASQLKLDNDWKDPSRMSAVALGLEGFQGFFPSASTTAPIPVVSVGQNLGYLYAIGGNVYAHNDSVSLADTLTKVTGAHSIRLGVFVERGRKQQNGITDQSVVLGSPWTPSGTGSDYGDLLTGRMAQYYQTTDSPRGEFRFWSFEGYLQDSWKVRRNLTVEAGVRVAKMPNNEELTDHAVRFEPSAYDPTQGAYVDGDPQRPNGVLQARRGEIPDGITDSPGVKVMPRLNFAWDPLGSGSFTVRGGAGLFYNRVQGNWQYDVLGQPPNMFNAAVNWYDMPDGILSFAGLSAIDPWSRLGASSIRSIDARSIEIPRTWSWSLAVAKRLPWQQALEVAYVGNRADHLPNQMMSNYVPPGSLTGTYGNADLDNPLHRAALDSSVVASFRTYAAYGNLGLWYQLGGWSSYNALQATLSRTAGRRVQYFLNYTFGKALGTTGRDWGLLDPIEPRLRSYGRMSQDRTHLFNASYNVLVPDPVRPDGNAVLRGLLNGWQVSGITSYRSGRPVPVFLSGELALDSMQLAWWGTDAHLQVNSFVDNNQSAAVMPVLLGDPRTGRTGTGEKILDIDRLAIPALGESGPFQSPYDVRAPSRWNWDVTLFKNFPLGGDKRLQLRVGFFNLFNQAVPDLLQGDIDLNLQVECNVRVDGVPNGAGGYADGVCDPTQGFRFSDLTRENFGKILTKRGHRVIELAARFDF